MTVSLSWRRLLLALMVAVAGMFHPRLLQGQAGAAPKVRGTVPVLLLSDIHLDPFHDPAKVAKLAATRAGQWDAVLGAPASATQERDFAALQEVCHLRGVDTSPELWRSSLKAMKKQAAGAALWR